MGIFHRGDGVTGSEGAGEESNSPCIFAKNNQAVQDNRELDFLRRENALMVRILESTRRELAWAQRANCPNVHENEQQPVQNAHSRVGVKAVAKLLSFFDGKTEDFPGWSKQVWVLSTT
ncbi:hypothetical protein KM043_016627 [Ampulex compressa]|nr:hypothetical protein KM043_016627 [Ampulex compressa]